jgi:trigger factor
MQYKTQELDKSQIQFTITVPPNEYQKDLESAAQRISGRLAVKGFRKGKVPFDMVKKEVGDMAILQEALEDIVRGSYVEALKQEAVESIGMPQIEFEKTAPGNELVYRATVALLPSVTLTDLSKISIKKKEASVDDVKIDETLSSLRNMHATEVIKNGPAEGTDKLVLDMDMFLDKVPVDGGQAKDYQVYLSEDHYIPGFNAHVVGMKKGDEKEFSLDFPKTHYQKMLAGKTVGFKVKAKDVFTRTIPEADESFAKKLGQDSLETLKDLLRNNLLADEKRKTDQQAEIELLDAIIEKSTFAPLPAVLIDSERQKIFYELKRDLERNGISIDQYLSDIKKTEAELFEGFTEQATKRAHAALVSREVAKQQRMTVSEEEIEAELGRMKEAYAHDSDAQENLTRPEVRDSIATMVQNKKVMAFLKQAVFGVAEPVDDVVEVSREQSKEKDV